MAPPHTNGGVAARTIPRAQLKALPGVGHYDFLATCTPAAFSRDVPMCRDIRVAQGQTHFEALQAAIGFFSRTLGMP